MEADCVGREYATQQPSGRAACLKRIGGLGSRKALVAEFDSGSLIAAGCFRRGEWCGINVLVEGTGGMRRTFPVSHHNGIFWVSCGQPFVVTGWWIVGLCAGILNRRRCPRELLNQDQRDKKGGGVHVPMIPGRPEWGKSEWARIAGDRSGAR